MSSRGINKVILIGNLGTDPEVRYMPSGSAVANISLATNETWKDKQSGEQKVRTEWHRICFFNRLAEIVGEYLRKGSKLYVEGTLRTRKWQDQSGNDRYTTEIIANEMQMLDSRGDASQGGGQFAASSFDTFEQGGGAPMGMPTPEATTSATSSAPKPPPQTQATKEPAAAGDFDDEIPF